MTGKISPLLSSRVSSSLICGYISFKARKSSAALILASEILLSETVVFKLFSGDKNIFFNTSFPEHSDAKKARLELS